ncbi:MAG TPA: DEAD/DEAH box helicase, partial [Streptomyces sp.]|nr:DEAD/DEAH box helicase [Streptomyces sp.]
AMDGAVDRLRAVSTARDRTDPLRNPTPNGSAAGPGTHRAPTPWDDLPDGSGLHRPDPDEPFAPAAFSSAADFDAGPHGEHSAYDQDGPHTDDAPYGRGGPDSLSSPHTRTGRDPHRTRTTASPRAVVLAAADPANAYGAALPWPEPPTEAGHKPGRKAGSLVVLVDGELTVYMERGGKTLLAWPADPDARPMDDPRLRPAAEALAAAARAGSLGTVTVERVNGTSALTSPHGPLLEAAGFIATPRGLRIRA